jgi:hypothetical protein
MWVHLTSPWRLTTELSFLQESLRQNKLTRFYIKQKEDPHGPHIAMYVGNLPTGLSQKQYEKILGDILGKGDHSYPESWVVSKRKNACRNPMEEV